VGRRPGWSIKESGIYLTRCRAARVVLSQLTLVKSTVVAFSIVVTVAGDQPPASPALKRPGSASRRADHRRRNPRFLHPPRGRPCERTGVSRACRAQAIGTMKPSSVQHPTDLSWFREWTSLCVLTTMPFKTSCQAFYLGLSTAPHSFPGQWLPFLAPLCY
jgi:hypothetical protein